MQYGQQSAGNSYPDYQGTGRFQPLSGPQQGGVQQNYAPQGQQYAPQAGSEPRPAATGPGGRIKEVSLIESWNTDPVRQYGSPVLEGMVVSPSLLSEPVPSIEDLSVIEGVLAVEKRKFARSGSEPHCQSAKEQPKKRIDATQRAPGIVQQTGLSTRMDISGLLASPVQQPPAVPFVQPAADVVQPPGPSYRSVTDSAPEMAAVRDRTATGIVPEEWIERLNAAKSGKAQESRPRSSPRVFPPLPAVQQIVPAQQSVPVQQTAQQQRRISPPKDPAPRGPIRMMKGRPVFDSVSALRDSEVPGITWGQLFALAPVVKRDIAKQLVQERSRQKLSKGKAREVLTVEAVGKGLARPEDDKPLVNFYTVGRISQAFPGSHLSSYHSVFTMDNLLIDGGSVLNLMGEDLARRLGFSLQPSRYLMMRTANGSVNDIKWHVDLDINVAGVSAISRVYCIPFAEKPSYSILLGRRWMRQCQAMGDYENNLYVIKDMAGSEYVVKPTSEIVHRQDIPAISINNADNLDLSEEFDEDTMLELELGPDGIMEALVRQIVSQSEDQINEEEGYLGDIETPYDTANQEYLAELISEGTSSSGKAQRH